MPEKIRHSKTQPVPTRLLQPGLKLGLGVTRELASRTGTGQTLAASRPATIDDRTTVLRRHTGQKTELADATFL